MTQFEGIWILLTVLSLALQASSVIQRMLRGVMVDAVSNDTRQWKCAMIKRDITVQQQKVTQQTYRASTTSFGDCVRMLREQRGWSRPQLVKEMDACSPEKIGPSTLTILRWEKGDCLPTKSNLALLCLVFGVSKEDLGMGE